MKWNFLCFPGLSVAHFRLVATCCAGFLVLSETSTYAQRVYVSDSSVVRFSSNTPVEFFSAENHAATVMVNMASQTVKAQVPIAAFEFDNKLMQEHFMEGYLEPGKFPYATFRGKLSDSLDLSLDTLYAAQATGMLNIHGIDRVRTFSVLMVCRDSTVQVTSDFNVSLADHDVKVPGAVFESIAKEVSVHVYFRMVPFEKED